MIHSLRHLCAPLSALLAFSSINLTSSLAQQSQSPDQRLANILERFPDSDANQDGNLTQAEAAAFFRDRREKMEPKKTPRKSRPDPTHADVSYGEHEKQAFDLWLVPDASESTPLVLFIHGGGFRSGDKSAIPPSVIENYLEAGIAFAAMNYRLSDLGPYPMMMEDCARGLQTIRHHAAEWNLDPEKIAAYGGSAGAGISLWLGFHDDLADPESEDPISRESTRLVAVGTMNGQSTYDINDFREWFGLPELQPGPALPAFYAVTSDADWESDRVKDLMIDASSINHLTKDDVPVYMIYSRPNTDITLETSSSEWVHHVKLGLKLQKEMEKLGLECVVTGPDVTPENDPYGKLEAFLIQKLTD
ncbi:MAG: alpha/beta hydrolase [Verrucomicrobiota bacterium]